MLFADLTISLALFFTSQTSKLRYMTVSFLPIKRICIVEKETTIFVHCDHYLLIVFLSLVIISSLLNKKVCGDMCVNLIKF